MRSRAIRTALCAGVILMAAAITAVEANAQARRMSVVVNGVRLAALDYGGSGTGLIFLAGLGDSPHAYDEIAPQFTGRFHVLAYARRAHGGSDAKPPYDIPTLADDLDRLLEQLQIRRAVLVGWSMGGLEITEFAERHPDRVAGVVFLDTYDLSGPGYRAMLAHYPVSYQTSAADRASPAAFRAWWKRLSAPDVPWSPAMRAEVDDLYQRLPGGAVRPHVTDSLEATFLAELMAYHPQYAAIRAPVLAFQAEPYAGAMVSADAPDSIRRKVAGWIASELQPWQAEVHARFARALPEAQVVVLRHTGHSALPFQRRDLIVSALRAFLHRLPG